MRMHYTNEWSLEGAYTGNPRGAALHGHRLTF